jgi:hypothetical protein
LAVDTQVGTQADTQTKDHIATPSRAVRILQHIGSAIVTLVALVLMFGVPGFLLFSVFIH